MGTGPRHAKNASVNTGEFDGLKVLLNNARRTAFDVSKTWCSRVVMTTLPPLFSKNWIPCLLSLAWRRVVAFRGWLTKKYGGWVHIPTFSLVEKGSQTPVGVPEVRLVCRQEGVCDQYPQDVRKHKPQVIHCSLNRFCTLFLDVPPTGGQSTAPHTLH